MARNSLAGKHESYKKLGMSPEAIKKKQARDAAYNKKPKQVAYRQALNKANRAAGTYGNLDKKDMGHLKGGGLKKVAQSKNRSANGQGKKSRFHA